MHVLVQCALRNEELIPKYDTLPRCCWCAASGQQAQQQQKWLTWIFINIQTRWASCTHTCAHWTVFKFWVQYGPMAVWSTAIHRTQKPFKRQRWTLNCSTTHFCYWKLSNLIGNITHQDNFWPKNKSQNIDFIVGNIHLIIIILLKCTRHHFVQIEFWQKNYCFSTYFPHLTEAKEWEKKS